MVLALVLTVSAIAYAETQSVKVSGDITVRTFARNNYDLDNDDPNPFQFGVQSTDWATHLMSTTEVQIDADLTDNVSGVIRLVNQRVWGNNQYYSAPAGETGNVGVANGRWDLFTAAVINPGNGDEFDIVVDLAYIELKEFLYRCLQ
jgi:hypothetical protein